MERLGQLGGGIAMGAGQGRLPGAGQKGERSFVGQLRGQPHKEGQARRFGSGGGRLTLQPLQGEIEQQPL